MSEIIFTDDALSNERFVNCTVINVGENYATR